MLKSLKSISTILPAIALSTSLVSSDVDATNGVVIDLPTSTSHYDVTETVGSCRHFEGKDGSVSEWNTVRYTERKQPGITLDRWGVTPAPEENTVPGTLCDTYNDVEHIALPKDPTDGNTIIHPFSLEPDVRKITTGGPNDIIFIDGNYNSHEINIYDVSQEVTDPSGRKIIFASHLNTINHYNFSDRDFIVGNNTMERETISFEGTKPTTVYAGEGNDTIIVEKGADTSLPHEIIGDNPQDTSPSSVASYTQWDTLKLPNEVDSIIDMREPGSQLNGAANFILSGVDALQFGNNTSNIFVASGDNQGVAQVGGGYESHDVAYFLPQRNECSYTIDSNKNAKVTCPDTTPITLKGFERIHFGSGSTYVSLDRHDPDIPGSELRFFAADITESVLPSGYCAIKTYEIPGGKEEVAANLLTYIDQRAAGQDNTYPDNLKNIPIVLKSTLNRSFARSPVGVHRIRYDDHLKSVDSPVVRFITAVMPNSNGECRTYDESQQVTPADRFKSEVPITSISKYNSSEKDRSTKVVDNLAVGVYIASTHPEVGSYLHNVWQNSSKVQACQASNPNLTADTDNNGRPDYIECLDNN